MSTTSCAGNELKFNFLFTKKISSLSPRLIDTRRRFHDEKICQSSPRICFILQSGITFFSSSLIAFFLLFSTFAWPYGFFYYFLMLFRDLQEPQGKWKNLNKILRDWSQLWCLLLTECCNFNPSKFNMNQQKTNSDCIF